MHYMFPKKGNMRDKWIAAIGNQNFNPIKYMSLCSRHFTEDCFYYASESSKRRRRLKPDAIPTLFQIPTGFRIKCKNNSESYKIPPERNELYDFFLPGRTGTSVTQEFVIKEEICLLDASTDTKHAVKEEIRLLEASTNTKDAVKEEIRLLEASTNTKDAVKEEICLLEASTNTKDAIKEEICLLEASTNTKDAVKEACSLDAPTNTKDAIREEIRFSDASSNTTDVVTEDVRLIVALLVSTTTTDTLVNRTASFSNHAKLTEKYMYTTPINRTKTRVCCCDEKESPDPSDISSLECNAESSSINTSDEVTDANGRDVSENTGKSKTRKKTVRRNYFGDCSVEDLKSPELAARNWDIAKQRILKLTKQVRALQRQNSRLRKRFGVKEKS